MKSKKLPFLAILLIIPAFGQLMSQEIRHFPLDPFVVLKSWNYDELVKVMGNGEEIIARQKNQDYVAGLRYPYEFLGYKGKLEFSFNQDSISRYQFRFEHAKRVVNADRSDKRTRDPSTNQQFDLAIQKLDSIQRLDSLSRDSIVRGISEIMDRPLSNGATAATEKFARHSAIWINHGYSCQYKDYLDYSEIIFTLSTVPLWVVGEFNIPNGTGIIRKMNVSTRKMNCTASLLGFSPVAPKLAYSDFFLLFEFTTGQRYLVSIPKNPIDFIQFRHFVDFAGGSRCYLSIPQNAIGYLPYMTFEDCDGDAIPEAWIRIPGDSEGTRFRHLLYSIQFKEPNLIFDTDEVIPSTISIQGNSRVTVIWPDGSSVDAAMPAPVAASGQGGPLHPGGFAYLNSTRLNNDGSTNFTGGIALKMSAKSQPIGILEINYRHVKGGWEPGEVKVIPAGQHK